jgi:hypothetical protein
MELNYYIKDELHHLVVNQPCPGCGKMDQLVVHKKVISYCNNRADYWIGCNCGWTGPIAKAPYPAATSWDMRFIYIEL